MEVTRILSISAGENCITVLSITKKGLLESKGEETNTNLKGTEVRLSNS